MISELERLQKLAAEAITQRNLALAKVEELEMELEKLKASYYAYRIQEWYLSRGDDGFGGKR